MKRSMNEQIRIDRNLMTVAQFDLLVTECLGRRTLVGIVGNSNTGKSWAARDWVNHRRDDIELAAYIDCRFPGLSVSYSLSIGGGIRMLHGDCYPRQALDGVDIVVVDDPAYCLPFVQTLVTLTSPTAGAGAHRMVVLLLQDIRLLRALTLSKNQFRCFTTSGKPIGDVMR